jgi:spermidine synthase
MPKLKSAGLLPWVVAFLEGFSTLAVEVIAIRLAVPVVGSSVVLTGVMLGIVLFALSAGYWRGGALSAKWDRARTRKALAGNLLLATALYGVVAFPFEARLLDWLLNTLSLPQAIGLTAILLFLAPIYFASQTVPMLAELTSGEDGKAGRASGKVLFFSTLGSVAGGVLTPVYLFPALGVARSSYLVCAVLALAGCIMLSDRQAQLRAAIAGSAAVLAAVLVQAATSPAGDLFSFDSAYQTIRIVDEKAADNRTERLMLVGGGRASGIYADTGETSFAYTLVGERMLRDSGAKRVLVLGAAGFTFPRDAAKLPRVEQVDAVDVDPSVREIAERHFLRERLPATVRFLPWSARFAVRRLGKMERRYGFTFVDTYFGKGIPEELVTAEFFRDVRAISDRTVVNAQMDRAVESAFARNLLASFREAFGAVWLVDAKPDEDSETTNMLVLSWPAQGSKPWDGVGQPYRDDRNKADRDRVAMVWGDDGS